MSAPALKLMPIAEEDQDQKNWKAAHPIEFAPEQELVDQLWSKQIPSHVLPPGVHVELDDGRICVGDFVQDRFNWTTAGELKKAKLKTVDHHNQVYLELLARREDSDKIVFLWD